MVLVLLVAVAVALGLRIMYSSSQQVVGPRMVSIPVAVARLPVGLLIKADDLAWRDIPEGEVKPGSVIAGSKQAPKLAGAVVRRAVNEGDPVLDRDVVFPDSPGFLAAALRPDMRAVSLAIDDVTGNAGLTQPGDRVDILLTQRIGEEGSPEGRKVATEAILGNVRVIAVGRALRMTEGETSTAASARTVTLEVTPRAAEVVAVAARLGQQSLVLRSLATRRPGEAAEGELEVLAGADHTVPVWGKDVSTAVRMSERRTMSSGSGQQTAPVRLTVIRGSKREDSEAAQAGGR